VDRKLESVRYPDIFKRLTEVQAQLKAIDKFVSLVYIPGHTGITGNDFANENASKLANSIASGNTDATDNITVTDVYKLATGIVMRSWQRMWNEDSTGRTTYSFIPEVGTEVIFPKRGEVGVSYCRILLHDTMLNDDAFRTGTADTYMCECGQEWQTVEDVLLHCTRYVEARSIMKDYLSNICNNLKSKSKQKRNIEVDESLLMAPFNYTNSTVVHRKEDKYIKEALFDFLSSVDRRI